MKNVAGHVTRNPGAALFIRLYRTCIRQLKTSRKRTEAPSCRCRIWNIYTSACSYRIWTCFTNISCMRNSTKAKSKAVRFPRDLNTATNVLKSMRTKFASEKFRLAELWRHILTPSRRSHGAHSLRRKIPETTYIIDRQRCGCGELARSA